MRDGTGGGGGVGPAALAWRSLSDLEIVGCKSAAAVQFSPSFCPIAPLWGCKPGNNRPRWGRLSLSTIQIRQTPGGRQNLTVTPTLNERPMPGTRTPQGTAVPAMVRPWPT